ncbi:MAG: hypothetical protein HY913_06590 [Desulfomonile tiedjei]|nr:hypothetical protein [Desulfomonile tiedjei]
MIILALHFRMADMTQLLLPFATPPRFTLDNLVIHEGIREALLTIRSVYESGELPRPFLFLHGAAGTGKTHMMNALASHLKERLDPEKCLVKLIVPVGSPASFPDLEELVTSVDGNDEEKCAVLVDDVHLMDDHNKHHLWNLSNQLVRSGAPLIMSSRLPPDEIFENDPHMKSRITAGLVLWLEPPEDSVRVLILDKMARDKHVRISPDVTHYLVTRKSRNVNDLSMILDILDRSSLELQRRITLPLIKLLEKQGAL